MRIGIDIRALGSASGHRGVGTYIRGLISGLAETITETRADVLLFSDRTGEGLPAPAPLRGIRLSRPRRAITLWDQLAWPPLLARRRVTVFHSPFYAIPRLRLRRCGVVQTIHDLTPLRLRDCVSPHNARVFRINFSLARSADCIIVPSEATRGDVETLLRIPSERIAVIPEATDITSEDISDADRGWPALSDRLGVRRRFLLHTGGHDRVKNLPRLLDAFAGLVREGRDLALIVAGAHTQDTGALIERAARHGLLDRVILPGFVSRSDLIALYRRAEALVYPSIAEGFGLPVLEAMACGTPVVTARAGGLPEVGGDACLYVDPADARAILCAVARVLDEPGLATDLSSRGRSRSARFSWRETARRTLDAYRKVAA